MTVLNFPEPPEKPPALLIGPFTYHQVVVEGRAIPRLTGYPREDGTTSLIVDDRFCVDVPNDLAPQVAWLVANAMAVGAGYTHLAASNKDQCFAPTCSVMFGDPV